jgi:hypothetical protein
MHPLCAENYANAAATVCAPDLSDCRAVAYACEVLEPLLTADNGSSLESTFASSGETSAFLRCGVCKTVVDIVPVANTSRQQG